jgi:hypothetical protein
MKRKVKMEAVVEKKKKKVNGKAKGGAFELKVSKIFTDKLVPLKFKKSQMSGAIVGGMNAKTIGDYSKLTLALFTGDVVPTNECVDGNPRFNYVIECKFYKEAERMEALFGTSHIYEWMKEAAIDAVKVDKRGVLIFKFNNTPIYAAVEADIELPSDVKFLTLLNGIKVCHFEDLIMHPTFWMK